MPVTGKSEDNTLLNSLIKVYGAAKHVPGYGIWCGVKARCKPYSRHRKDYFERGISYDKRWESFSNFLVDMGVRPVGMSIERIDNTLGYSKDNCVWADAYTQANNTRNTIHIRCGGIVYTLSEIMVVTKIPHETLRRKVHLPEFKCKLERTLI